MQETNSRQTLCSQLKTVDASLLFLLFIILSVVLSYAAVGIQRRQLADTLAGNTQAAGLSDPLLRQRPGNRRPGLFPVSGSERLAAGFPGRRPRRPKISRRQPVRLCAGPGGRPAAAGRSALFAAMPARFGRERRPARLSGAKGGQEILSPWYPSSAALPPGRR